MNKMLDTIKLLFKKAKRNTYFRKQICLQAYDLEKENMFGNSVAISADGNTLAIGARYDDNKYGKNAGSVYIFRNNGVWKEQTQLQACDACVGGQFGRTVAINADGSVIAIGAHTNSNLKKIDAGSVYIFVRRETTWSQHAKLIAPYPSNNDLFGLSISLSADGKTLAVGSKGNNKDFNVGAVYIFTNDNDVWKMQAELHSKYGKRYGCFGNSVSLSSDGNTLVVGAYKEDNLIGNEVGAAYVFIRNENNAWIEQAKICPNDAVTYGRFGKSVNLSGNGNVLAVSAQKNVHSIGENTRTVYIFTKDDDIWREQTKLQSNTSINNWFGNSFALNFNGNILAVGAPRDDGFSRKDIGSVYVFTRDNDVWAQKTKLLASCGEKGDEFGNAVAINADGSVLAIGSWLDDNEKGIDAGSVYVLTT